LVLGQSGIGRSHSLLQLDAALDRIEDTGKFDEHTIAHHLDNAAVVHGHQRLQNL